MRKITFQARKKQGLFPRTAALVNDLKDSKGKAWRGIAMSEKQCDTVKVAWGHSRKWNSGTAPPSFYRPPPPPYCIFCIWEIILWDCVVVMSVCSPISGAAYFGPSRKGERRLVLKRWGGQKIVFTYTTVIFYAEKVDLCGSYQRLLNLLETWTFEICCKSKLGVVFPVVCVVFCHIFAHLYFCPHVSDFPVFCFHFPSISCCPSKAKENPNVYTKMRRCKTCKNYDNAWKHLKF